jgi:serine protease inhibitor
MRLYLIDAIYFKGDGTAQFDANLTQPRPQQ